jgi:S1-C subfamily serine protease
VLPPLTFVLLVVFASVVFFHYRHDFCLYFSSRNSCTRRSDTATNNTSSASNSIPKNIGISFAVPSNSIFKIIPSLLSKGYYEHPWFGVSGTDVNLDIAKDLNLNESRGFLVIDVAPLSPAK